MGFYDAIRVGASGAAEDFTVDRSLRFNASDSTDLQRTPSSAGNRKVWTWSAWVKRGKLGLNTATLFHAYDGSSSNRGVFNFQSDDTLNIDQGGGSGSSKGQAESDMVFRDVSAWYHIVIRANYSDSTASDRIKLYVNGTQQTLTFDVAFVDEDGQINGNFAHQIGEHGGGNYFDGYMAEVNFIDGQALTPSSFAETDADTGQWNPIDTSGLTFGTNGFRLKFADNSGTTATTLGKDSSGNGNNFTPSNFSVSAGAGNDSVEDTPTNNFCVMNPLDMHSSMSTKNGNLQVVEGNDWRGIKGTFGVSSGKWYYEFKTGNSNIFCGWASDDLNGTNNNSTNPQDDNSAMSKGVLIFCDNGKYQLDTGGSGTRINYSSALAVNDVLGCAIDLDNNTAQFYKQGSALGSIDISSSKLATKKVMPYFICHPFSNPDYTFNFGQQAFAYTPPTGYKALSSANLPDPTILLPNKHFDTLLYSGTGSSQNITGLEFQPDWVWIKKRSGSDNHNTADAVRGAGKSLRPNTTGAETTSSGAINAFLSNGFTVVDAGETNESGHTYAGWNWNAGGSTVTNTDGTISAQVRANASAGFSIVTYTGNGSNSTVGHGLGVKPDTIIVKGRNIAGQDWVLYNKNLDGGNQPATHIIKLNTTAAEADVNDVWNDTEPTSTVFSVGVEAMVNYNTSTTYVAYCFSEVAGYSKFGSYTGNGSSDGTCVFTGFKPAWLMIKRTDSGAAKNWFIHDNKREGYNPQNDYVSANTGDAETNVTDLDILSNGFKLRSNGQGHNASGATYIYIAFAEAPFKNARAR